MSPSKALQSPVFLFYLVLVLSLLLFAGAVLAVLKWGLRKNVGHAWDAYRGWLFIVPVLLLVYFLGREAAVVFVATVSVVCFHEFARAAGLEADRVVTGAVDVGIVALGITCLFNDPADGRPGWYDLFMTIPVFVVAVIVAIPVIRNLAQGQLRLVALAVFGFIYFGWLLSHLAFLANSTWAYAYLGYLVLAVELNDVAAYSCGKLLGRHPLRSAVSPNKTWEGAAGAVLVSLALPWVLHFTFPHFTATDCLVVGMLVGVGGQLGDLVVSVLKRDLGVKDLGWIIPGHGGILDRVDSLIYVAPVFFHYLRFRHAFHPL